MATAHFKASFYVPAALWVIGSAFNFQQRRKRPFLRRAEKQGFFNRSFSGCGFVGLAYFLVYLFWH
jgi:hypothetical protein